MLVYYESYRPVEMILKIALTPSTLITTFEKMLPP